MNLPFRLLEIIFNYKMNYYRDIKKKLLIGKTYNEYVIKLDLYYKKLEGYKFINRLINLEYLDLGNTKISDINNLPKSLIGLTLDFCGKIDISILSEMKSLEILWMGSAKISDINNLPTSLIVLGLYNCNKITNFRILSEMKSLEVLQLGNTNISDINNLPKSLIELDLYNCKEITDYSGLDKLPNCKINR